jgi:uncharacterized membrane protein
MVHCTKCGAQVPDNSRFCQSCGQPQPVAAGANPNPTSNLATSSGLQENVAGLLCYLFWWVTGIIFYLIDRRPFVRFHALQSIITFGALSVIHWVLSIAMGAGWWFGGPVGWTGVGALAALLYWILHLVWLVVWIVCMVKAYQGVRFKLPIVGDIAENAAAR